MFKINKYYFLRFLILINLLKKRKINLKKILNFLQTQKSYFLKSTYAGKSPVMMNFELWNECNENCVFCRSNIGEIFNLNPNSKEEIKKGKLDIKIYENIIDELKDYLILSIPYINGEPFLSKNLYRAVDYASKKNVGTLVASNGIIINENNAKKILASGLDFLKVHISGFTQDVHSIEHRKGNVETIKKNLENIAKLNSQGNYNCLIMLDFIHYKHNNHEVEIAKKFADENNLIFNLRKGIVDGIEDVEGEQTVESLPVNLPCPYLWSMLSIDWNNEIYPCCNYVMWGETKGYENFNEKTSILNLWNSEKAKKMREIHLKEGRTPIPICAKCPQSSSAFKY